MMQQPHTMVKNAIGDAMGVPRWEDPEMQCDGTCFKGFCCPCLLMQDTYKKHGWEKELQQHMICVGCGEFFKYVGYIALGLVGAFSESVQIIVFIAGLLMSILALTLRLVGQCQGRGEMGKRFNIEPTKDGMEQCKTCCCMTWCWCFVLVAEDKTAEKMLQVGPPMVTKMGQAVAGSLNKMV